jgi:hypothetical protein
MKTMANCSFLYKTLLFTIGILLAAAPAYSAGFTLNTSSLTTNNTASSTGTTNGFLSWDLLVGVSTSYSASSTALSLNEAGTAISWIGLVGNHGGTFGRSQSCQFEADAYATWTASGGGPSEILTTTTDILGNDGSSNNITFGQYCTFEQLIGYAGGAAVATLYNIQTNTSFINITNNSTNSVLTSSHATTSDMYIYEDIDLPTFDNGYYTSIWNIHDCNFSMTWTNMYITAAGLTSISAYSSILGVAGSTLDVTDPSPDDARGNANGYIEMIGSLNVSLKQNLN